MAGTSSLSQSKTSCYAHRLLTNGHVIRVVSEEQTQVIRLYGQQVYLMSHPTDLGDLLDWLT